jgi:hypothetical protein
MVQKESSPGTQDGLDVLEEGNLANLDDVSRKGSKGVG